MSNVKKKVLLMGKSGSGKTSMRSVIFSNMIAKDTSRLGATIDVEHSHVRFLGNLVLNLWDCGGQESFLSHYVSTKKSQIFSNVAILIYVFDATVPVTYSTSTTNTEGELGQGQGQGVGGGGVEGGGGADGGMAGSPASANPLNGNGNGNGNSNGNGNGSTLTEWEKDLKYFEECLEALYTDSFESSNGNDEDQPNPTSNPQTQNQNQNTIQPPGVWILINKMDLMADPARPEVARKVLGEKREELERVVRGVGRRFGLVGDEGEGEGVEEARDGGEVGREVGKQGRGKWRGIRCFGTSIWDESLYKAWSSVIHTLIPNASLIRSHLTHLRNISSSLEAILFERQTFLVLAKSGSELDADANDGDAEAGMGWEGLDAVEVRGGARGLERKRFEKISEVVKGFRQTCQRSSQPFVNLEARFPNATIALDVLTSNTYLMLVSSEDWVEPGLLMFNIEQARYHFEELSGDIIKTPCLICKDHAECRYEPLKLLEGEEEWGHG